jgi:hypothetical protein
VTVLTDDLADRSDDLAQEEDDPSATRPDGWAALLARISRLSVTRHFDAYGDIAWDSPELTLDPTDRRWELAPDDGLGRTAWYQALPQEQRARIGLDLIASKMKIGLQFESVLKQGLLQFAARLPNNSPEFRYAYHEVIEEAQHSLMFQEFVNRSGFDAAGLSRMDQLGARFVTSLGRRFPPLFFVFVLGGEDPIDYVQREDLRSGRDLHPLLERIMRIHVTEEARHLSFARHYLKREVPALSRLRRTELSIGAPLVLGVMAEMMLKPSRQIVRRHAIPDDVLDEAYRHNPAQRAAMLASLRKVRRLCEDLGLLGPVGRRLWKSFGLLEEAG